MWKLYLQLLSNYSEDCNNSYCGIKLKSLVCLFRNVVSRYGMKGESVYIHVPYHILPNGNNRVLNINNILYEYRSLTN